MTISQIPLSFVPSLLPNQTLYSWWEVFHEMSGNSTADESLVQTFALMRKGLHFHIPSHLDAFCASTQLALGSAETIVQTATTIPYYTIFRSPGVAARVLKLARGNSSHGVSQTLGMAKTATHAHPPRRSCHTCIQSDKAKLGFAYWRRDHQLPGVLVCQEHGTPLLSLPHDHTSIRSGNLLWPNNDWESLNASAHPEWPTTSLTALRRIAQLAADMSRGALVEGYSIRKMRSALLSPLVERNLIAPDGSLIVAKALNDYESHHGAITSAPEIAFAAKHSIRPLVYLLRQDNCRTHPLEWMLIIDWLFGDWATFEKCYQLSIMGHMRHEAK
ncbi:MAG: TniQ family protein [Gallionella sp.]|nr:TniQ family protein [Gallionella sp.]